MRELQSANNVNLLLVDQWLQEEKSSIEQIGQSINSIFCLSNSDLTIRYVNPAAHNWLSASPFEDFDISLSDLKSYYHPRISEKLLKRINSLETQGSAEEIFYDIDKVWFPKNTDYELCLIASKYSKAFDGFLISMETVSESTFIDKKLSRLAEEVRFVKQNENRFSSLTDREKEILLLVSLGHNNPAISDQLCISRSTVEQHRKNINRKLGVSSLLNLIRYTQAFELI